MKPYSQSFSACNNMHLLAIKAEDTQTFLFGVIKTIHLFCTRLYVLNNRSLLWCVFSFISGALSVILFWNCYKVKWLFKSSANPDTILLFSGQFNYICFNLYIAFNYSHCPKAALEKSRSRPLMNKLRKNSLGVWPSRLESGVILQVVHMYYKVIRIQIKGLRS